VARLGSAALAKTVRALGKRFVAVTCHQDVEDWLQPDWIYQPATNSFAWRFLQRRPAIVLEVFRCPQRVWRLFRSHHYLNTSLNPAAQTFLAVWEGRPVAFSAWLSALVKFGGKREHRTVTLPDYQGVGIGHALSSFCASLYKALGHRARSTTSHPAFMAARLRSSHWRLVRAPALAHPSRRTRVKHAGARLTAGFEYIGPAADPALARRVLGGMARTIA
jgi:GNAT superfamily N-acetyltransferase